MRLLQELVLIRLLKLVHGGRPPRLLRNILFLLLLPRLVGLFWPDVGSNWSLLSVISKYKCVVVRLACHSLRVLVLLDTTD